MIVRYLSLFIFTGCAGMLSSLLWPMPNGVMAAALGMSLSLATVWLGSKERGGDGSLSLKQALIAGAVAGLLGGLFMAELSELLYPVKSTPGPGHLDFGPTKLPFWAPIILGTLYGLVLHRSYYLRRFSKAPLSGTLWSACLGCFLLKAAATLVFLVFTESASEIPGILIGSVMLSLLGAVPFALLWTLATALLDPAWRVVAEGEEKADAKWEI